MTGLKRETDINLSYLLLRPKEKAKCLSQHAFLLFFLSRIPRIKIRTIPLRHVHTNGTSENLYIQR